MKLVSLSPEPERVPEHRVQRALDQILETGNLPTSEGQCSIGECHGQVVFQANNEESGLYYIPSPRCMQCGARYRLALSLHCFLPIIKSPENSS